MTELSLWALALITGIIAARLLEAVWKDIVDLCEPPAPWLWNWAAYLLYRVGLTTIARTYKLVLVACCCLPISALLIRATYWLWASTWSEDFSTTAGWLGCLTLIAALWMLIIFLQLISAALEDGQDDPYAAARTHAAQIHEHLNQPIYGRSGRASLADLRRAGLIE